jgi:2'-5' RNA ligase
MSTFDQYFMALVPPPDVAEEIQTLKKYVSEKFHSKAALRSPPHLTLHMPFQWRTDRSQDLLDSLQNFANAHSRIDLVLENFGCFEPRVIFIHAKGSAQLLQLQNDLRIHTKTKLQLFNALYQDLPFHPHVTIAFRDLKKNEFFLAWKAFQEKKFYASFEVSALTLLKHDGQLWNIHQRFPMTGN